MISKYALHHTTDGADDSNFLRANFPSRILGVTPNDCVKKGTPVDGNNWTDNPPHLGNGARYEVSYYYSYVLHAGFPLVPRLVALNDIERRDGSCFALFHRNRDIWVPHKSHLLKTDSHFPATKM